MSKNAQNYSLVMAFDVDRNLSKANMETALADLQKMTQKFNVSLQVDTSNFERMMKTMTEDIEGAIEKNTRKIVSTYTSALRGARREHKEAMQKTLKEIEQLAQDSKKKIQNIFAEPIKIKTNLQAVNSAEMQKQKVPLANKGESSIVNKLDKDIQRMYKDIDDVEKNLNAMGNRVKKSTAKMSQGELKGFTVEYTDSIGMLKKSFYEMRGILDETSGQINQVLMNTNDQVIKDYKRIESEQDKLLKRQKEVQSQIDKFKQNRFNNKGERTDIEKDVKTFEKAVKGADLYDTKSLKDLDSMLGIIESKTKKLGDAFDHKNLRKGLQSELSQLMTITDGLERAGVKLGKSKAQILSEFDKKILNVNNVDDKKMVNAEIRRMKAAFNQVPAMQSRMDWVENSGLVDEKKIKQLNERIRKSLTPENNAVIGVGINDLAAEIRVLNDAARYQKRINDLKKHGAMLDKDGKEFSTEQVVAMQKSLDLLKDDPTSKKMSEFKKEYGEMLRGQTGVEKEFMGKRRGLLTNLDDIRDKYKLIGADQKKVENLELTVNKAETIKDLDDIQKKYRQLSREMSQRYRGGVGQKEDIASASSMFAQRESLLAEVKQSYSRGLRGRYKQEYQEIEALAKSAEERLAAVKRGDPKASLVQTITGSDGKATFKNWTTQMDEIQARTVTLRNRMKELRGSTDTVGYAMRTAFEKFPVWMLASSAFYAPIRGLTDMYNIILQVDTQMTNLKRVMDADTNFDAVLAGNIEMAKELGKTVTDINYAMENFARSGNYSVDELSALTRTSTIASNVSDLSAQEMSETLITAMSVFNVEAEKSMMVIDKMNEVDNNFATTTKDLAVAMGKSAAAANTYGVSMDQLLGYITAIQEVTRDSGANIGNSLKTIFSRITMSGSVNSLKDVGIEVFNNDGTTREFSKIMDELAGKWNDLTNAQQQNFAVQLAGRYQLTR